MTDVINQVIIPLIYLLEAFFFVFMLLQNVVYQMMVSRELKLGQLYRNAFLFFLMNFGPCLAMIAVMIIFLIIIPFALIINTSYLTLGLFVFLYGFFMIAFIQYLLAFFTGGMLHKYMPAPKEDDDVGDGEEDSEVEESEETENNDIDSDE